MTKSFFFAVSLILSTVFVAPMAFADSHAMTSGVVRKIDMDNGKVTIKHGEIVNLDMPPMSMVFRVEDASILNDLSKGDKVKFVAAEKGGKLYVTEIQSAE